MSALQWKPWGTHPAIWVTSVIHKSRRPQEEPICLWARPTLSLPPPYNGEHLELQLDGILVDGDFVAPSQLLNSIGRHEPSELEDECATWDGRPRDNAGFDPAVHHGVADLDTGGIYEASVVLGQAFRAQSISSVAWFARKNPSTCWALTLKTPLRCRCRVLPSHDTALAS